MIKVVYNAPSKVYIGYDEEDVTNQVTATDAEVDKLYNQQQRASWNESEDAAEKEAADRGVVYQRREYEGLAVASSQEVRERLAHEIIEAKL